MKIADILVNYFKVLRLQRTINYSFMVFGALYANLFIINRSLLMKVLVVYIIFGFFMYGGIYSFNGYFERFEDSSDIRKRKRMIPSGKVKAELVLIISILMMSMSLILGYLLLRELFFFQIYLLIVNILYTTFFKRISAYLSILVIATTGPIKFLLGYFLVGNKPTFDVLSIVFTHYFCSIAYHSRKFLYNGKLSKTTEKIAIPLIYMVVMIVTFYNLTNNNLYILFIVAPALFESLRYYVDKKYAISVHEKWNNE